MEQRLRYKQIKNNHQRMHGQVQTIITLENQICIKVLMICMKVFVDLTTSQNLIFLFNKVKLIKYNF